MTTHIFSQYILNQRRISSEGNIDESAAKDSAELISGSLIYRLYESLVQYNYDMDSVTEHLEMLCNEENHHALLYIIFILCDAVDEIIPARFEVMVSTPFLVPYLSAAIIEDWLDFHFDYGS
jgi:hypothetical protein